MAGELERTEEPWFPYSPKVKRAYETFYNLKQHKVKKQLAFIYTEIFSAFPDPQNNLS